MVKIPTDNSDALTDILRSHESRRTSFEGMMIATSSNLAKRFDEWRRQLLDTSKRNRLINCTFGRGGAIELQHPNLKEFWESLVIQDSRMVFQETAPLIGLRIDEAETEASTATSPTDRTSLSVKQLEACRRSGRLRADALLTRLNDKALDARLKRLSVAAATSLSEQGVNSLFVACGLLKWFESPDSETPIWSPLVLVPVSLWRETVGSEWELAPQDEELLPNHPLAELLKTDFRITLPTFSEEAFSESADALDAFFDQVRGVALDRWTVEPTFALGAFAFQKIAMWHDLRDNEGSIAEHPVCRGMAGDDSALSRSDGAAVAEKELDQTPPDANHLIVDCDGSQLAAIEAVKQGRSLILDGPPGTGKSQTIANLIAECLAASKTVLFVSEKAAALEVVKRRLDKAGIGDFCLECHSHKANKKQIIDELGRCLNRPNQKFRSMEQELTDLRRSRDRLNEYVRALHAPQSNLDATPFEIHGRLARIQTKALSRWSIRDPFSVDSNQLRELREAVGRLKNSESIVATRGAHPWRGLNPAHHRLDLADNIRFHFSRAAAGLRKRLKAHEELSALGFSVSPPTIADFDVTANDAEAVLKMPDIPKRWIEGGLLSFAQGFIDLHEQADSHRILLSNLSNYRGEAVDRADPELFRRAADTTNLDSLLCGSQASVRGRAGRFGDAVGALDKLIEKLTALDAAAAPLRRALQLNDATDPTIADAEALARLALTFAELARLPAPWFEPETRDRLRKKIQTLRQISTMALAIRAALEPRMRPAAFMELASPQIDSLRRHDSWFRRWGGSWRRAKADFVLLYHSTPPRRAAQLLDDAHQLKRFHDYQRQLHAALDADAAILGWHGEMNFDWEAVSARLEQIHLLPSELQAARTRPAADSSGRFDASQITKLAAEVEQSCRAVHESTDRLAAVADLGRTLGIGDVARSSTATTKQRAITACDALREAAASLASVAVLLEARQDAPVKTLADDLVMLLEARRLRQSATQLAHRLGHSIQPAASRELCDVHAQAELARWVGSFVQMHNGSPPEHVLRVLSDSARRAQLTQAVDAVRQANDPLIGQSVQFARSLFEGGEPADAMIDLDARPAVEVVQWLQEQERDADRVSEWVSFATACANMDRLDLSVLREEILSHAVPVDEAVDALRRQFYFAWLAEAYKRAPALREFDLAEHTRHAARFRETDRFWIQNGFARVRRRLLAASPRIGGLDGDAPDQSEVGILQREANKKRRHMPIRKLFAALPTLLLKLKPCVMMSPLSVSTYFQSKETRFDVVIFDEASQVRPHDAVCAIYRGRQLVLAGDEKQLPPTNFFERLGEEEEAEDEEQGHDVRDFESILNVCSSLRFPRQRLKWHYRSRRESLIAFSNRHFYGNELITFPSVKDVDGSSGVEFTLVTDGVWSSRVNHAEAKAIGAAVIEHAKRHPDQSLGVITMNLTQQMRVMDEIEARRKANPELDSFFSADRPEPFIVKNLENIQGDERDVVFFGVGYAKNAAGVLSHNFGPLNRDGGERRLNVAVTRARLSLRLFSSITADDIDLTRTAKTGVHLLRAYLDFARRGPEALEAAVTSDSERDFDSEFEKEVALALERQGLHVRRQVGCSGYRIDLALVDPKRPGRYVLGVECDGATYHSSATARDRDRLRQEVLENLGWRMCRIWSTDWVRDPRRQLQKVLAAYEAALVSVDEEVSTAPTDVRLTPETVAGNPPPPPPQYSFEEIDEVDSALVEQIFADCIEKFGAVPIEDLMQHTARTLGFQRVGSRIKARFEAEIAKLLERSRIIQREDERVTLNPM